MGLRISLSSLRVAGVLAAALLATTRLASAVAVRGALGGGYVGAQHGPQGYALGEEAIRRFGLKKGDKAIIAANFDDSNRSVREASTKKAFEDIGMTVVVVNSPPEWAADPNLAI